MVEYVNVRDTLISFEEFHEKLINKELSLQQNRVESSLPATVFVASTRSHGSNYGNNGCNSGPGILPTPYTSNYQPRPFLGKCQWCREQGHVVAQCQMFNQRFPNVNPPPAPSMKTSRPNSKPQAHTASLTASSSTSPWLLDSGASHHVTTNLNNLSLHAAYAGTEELVFGDGTGLTITHFGSLFSFFSKA